MVLLHFIVGAMLGIVAIVFIVIPVWLFGAIITIYLFETDDDTRSRLVEGIRTRSCVTIFSMITREMKCDQVLFVSISGLIGIVTTGISWATILGLTYLGKTVMNLF